ncbi:OmpW family protein [Aquabacterium sp.]|uniref:OmpW/AlkL family protein n=1 Tax=Aquabacterium sp. TaxID=1872578 RepID=UPI0035B3DC1C
MKISTWSKWFAVVAVSGVTVLGSMAHAQESKGSIFAKVEPALRERMFMRLNYISANVKTTSGDAHDVTGAVVNRGDVLKYMGPGTQYATDYAAGLVPYTGLSTSASIGTQYINTTLDDAMTVDADNGCEAVRNGLGTPCGIKARSSSMVGTPAISLGYFLTDDYTWFAEAYVLAAPLRVTVYGDGANNLNGREIIKLKMLPPTGVLGRYFGHAKDRFRPFVGVGASYAVFFDTRATATLNTYQGGAGPNDTSVSLKNAIGVGPFAGAKWQVDDDWHVSLNIGKLRYKTEATLTTRNTTITGNSEVLSAYGAAVRGALDAGEALNVRDRATGEAVSTTTAVMCMLAKYRDGRDNCNLGTYVRKQSTVLDNTMFMLSVGRKF